MSDANAVLSQAQIDAMMAANDDMPAVDRREGSAASPPLPPPPPAQAPSAVLAAAAPAPAPQVATQSNGGMSEVLARVERLEQAVARLTQMVEANGGSAGLAQSIEVVNGRLNETLGNLNATLGYRAKETFQCGSCGSLGYVAARVLCTKCGKDTMFGWWPPQG